MVMDLSLLCCSYIMCIGCGLVEALVNLNVSLSDDIGAGAAGEHGGGERSDCHFGSERDLFCCCWLLYTICAVVFNLYLSDNRWLKVLYSNPLHQ